MEFPGDGLCVKRVIAHINVFACAVEVIEGVIVPAENNGKPVLAIRVGLRLINIAKDLPGFKIIKDLQRFKSFIGFCRLQACEPKR